MTDVPATESPSRSSALAWVTPLAYLSLAALFVTFYTVRTGWMEPWGIEGLTFTPPFPFRYRILSTFVAGGIWRLTGAPLAWIYAAQETLFVWGALLVFQRLLALHVRADLARLLAPGLLYGMAWHYCAMNLLHFPFDMPAIFFFVAGWYLLLRRRWRLFYPVFLLATLNRETSLTLTMVFALVWFRRLTWRALLGHVAAQALLWIGVKYALWLAFTPVGHQLYISSLAKNWETLVLIVTLRREGMRHLLKFLLWCGGLWAALPFIQRRLPDEIRRSLLAIVPFVLGMVFVGTLREMRIYGEVIPIVMAAALVWVGQRLDSRPPAPAASG